MNHPSFRGASQYNRTIYETWDLSFTEIEVRANMKFDAHSRVRLLSLFLKLLHFCIMRISLRLLLERLLWNFLKGITIDWKEKSKHASPNCFSWEKISLGINSSFMKESGFLCHFL